MHRIDSILEKYTFLIAMICLFAVTVSMGHLVPVPIKSFCYAISLTMKQIIVFLLPFIVFSFLFHSLIALKERAAIFIILLFTLVATSNFIAIMTGYTVGSTMLPIIAPDIEMLQDGGLKLQPMWSFSLPKLIANEPAMMAGILVGLFFAVKYNTKAEKVAKTLNSLSIDFLKKIFLPTLPVFILGFLLKLEHEQLLHKIFTVYGSVLLLVICTQVTYIGILYMIAANFRIKKFLEYIKNIIPATITAFSTISSAATMPITLIATEKNLGNANYAHMIIPTTCNIHTLGSALGFTILVLTTILTFNLDIPPLASFLPFAFYYTMAKFAIAGIPGGVVIVVGPLLETYLGFNPDMIGLITAMYLLFDPFGTAANVTCNGAFAIIFSKIYKKAG